MDNMKNTIGAGVTVILGLLGLIFWWDSFATVLKGGIPILLVVIGIISLVAGINEVKEASKTKTEEEKK